MLALTRPAKPDGFERRAQRAAKKIDAIINSGRHPKSSEFPVRWKDYKPVFEKAQHGKCGYCEHDVKVGYSGDVEHYAPKSGIECIVGTETERNKADARKTTPTPPSEPGYWWLAYKWDNYLFACAECNSVHKRCIFPVANGIEKTTGYPNPSIAYEPLLLNPFEDGLKPAQHLDFSTSGAITNANGSVRGWETIRTCGLDRPRLQEARTDRAHELARVLDDLQGALADADEHKITGSLGDIISLGGVRQRFAGMVRILTERRLRQPWAMLESLLRDRLKRRVGSVALRREMQ